MAATTTETTGALPVPPRYRRWHLYGAGLENVGKNGEPETVETPTPGPNEILVRHDACGICFSDIKIINLGGEHPRLVGRDLQKNPVVMGHEVTLTVVSVGENLKDRFAPGQRYIVQADVYYKGVNLAYGYALTGGMSQYGVIGPEVLEGDEGCYLLPIAEQTGDVEAALVEPWACVEAAYRWSEKRDPEAKGNNLIVLGDSDRVFDSAVTSRVWSPDTDLTFFHDEERFDEVTFFGTPTPERFEAAATRLAKNGRAVLLFEGGPLERAVKVDIGRIHYDNHAYVGFEVNDRNELKGNGVAWFIGAAGPMGQMHVQRALSLPNPPRKLLCTDRHDTRLDALRERFAQAAQERGVELILANVRTNGTPDLKAIAPDGFDDIVVMVPSIEAIEESFPYLAQGGVLNVFAGVARGTMATLDVSDIATKNVRIVGTSGSSIADMRAVRDKMEKGELDTAASLAAVGGLEAFREGLEGVKESRFPGKTVIFPHIANLPLTGLPDLKDVRPNVYQKLRDGKYWTHEAEEELLKEAKP
jgi:threonine dehydrogenase-like Zn-dependent dehydrogenase